MNQKINLFLVVFIFFGISQNVKSQDLLINEFLASNTSTNIDADYNAYSDWIELYNKSAVEINIGGYFLTDNLDTPAKWPIPAGTTIKSGEYLLFWADGNNLNNHTNFKLSKNGEEIGLYSPSLFKIDSLIFGAQQDDISYGRLIEDPSKWAFFNPPSPKLTNNSSTVIDVIPNPLFSITGGFYTGSQILSFSNSSQYRIYYTLDGTAPDETSLLYNDPISMNAITVVRARAYEDGNPPSDVVTHTFFINENINLPIISIVTDPDNFFSDERGIYVTGTNGREGNCDPWDNKVLRNVNQDWERPVNIEFYEINGDVGINQQAGIKIFGGCSRHRFPQKSLALYARKSYGPGSFNYKIFPDKDIDKFESFILRSSADDQVSTMFRDALGQSVLVETMDADYQAYRATIVYINGVYWGIHNIREKINEHFLAGNFGVDSENVNILESNGGTSSGTNAGYDNMVDYAANNNMADNSKYEVVKNQMDINQYIDYQIGHIYLAERDWPGNNIKFWRTNSGEYSKWRWINFDMDQTFTYQWKSEDMIEKTTTADGPGWPNPEWSTRLFRNLLDNEEFKNEFIQRYAWHMNTTFKPERLIGIIDSLSGLIAPEIPRHIVRWGGQLDPDFSETWPIKPTFSSVDEWNLNVDTMRIFANERPSFTLQNFINKFELSGTSQITVTSNIGNAGKLKILKYDIDDEEYVGTYFNDIPLRMEAESFIGYNFSYWTVGETEYFTNQLDLILNGDISIKAHFEPDTINTADKIVINEINYNSRADFDTKDWIEIYNDQDIEVDLSMWYLQDDNINNQFIFPNGTTIGPKNYLVVCDNIADFDSLFPNVKNRIGNFDFNLSNNGEVIKLFANANYLIDSVKFSNISPWPARPDGQGYTLELLDHQMDNNIAESWDASAVLFGSPGIINSTLTDIENRELYSIPSEYALYQNYPNPFNPSTTIYFSVKDAGIVKIKIYDVLGRLKRTLLNSNIQSGRHSAVWNGKDDGGSIVSSGIYFYSLESVGHSILTKKMLLLK